MSILLIIIHFFFWQFVFGFQRVTLAISRRISSNVGIGVHECQLSLTPNWVGLLGWVNRGLSIAVVVMVFVEYGLAWSIISFFMIYVGGYATLSMLFEPVIQKRGDRLVKQGLEDLKKTGHGYLQAWQIEKAMSSERKNEQETTEE